MGIPPGWHGLTSCWGRCRWRSGIPMASTATATAHHRNHLLTHPEDDPESYYVTAESWQRFSAAPPYPPAQHLLGRLLLAPMMDIIHTLNSALRAFHEGDRRAIAMWSLHLLLLTGLLTGWRRRVFSAVVCAGGELPGAGPDQSTLFSRTPRRG